LSLPTGETVSLHVNPEDIVHSVHGEREIQGVQYTTLQCTACHRDQQRYGFPHPELSAPTRRELTLQMESICQECHEEIYQHQRDSVHAAAIARGVEEAATCFDCHGNHAIQVPNEPRERISQTCGQCHSTINEEYTQSVHGAALLGEHNPDVAVCTDCHGVHNIPDPTTAAFRVQSPDLCADCHADQAKMAKYGISTDVFETYVADFHGTTVELFEKQTPWQETNKAVCYDCHGIHNILPADDEHSQVIRQNLVTTCRQCHPDATENFPDAWTSHFRPSLQHNPLIYLVDLFYTILIPTVVGGFLLFIGTDVYRSLWDRIRSRRRNE
jgi:predicted CXXCH cytochrome family protein